MTEPTDSGFSSGLHPLGCFYGGPEGEAFWFAVYGCLHEHDGDLEALWAPAENVWAAWDHLVQAGLTRAGVN